MRAVITTLATTLLALIAASSAAAGPARACVEQSEKLVGQRAGVAAQPLKKVRDAEPDYPARQGSSKALSSIWIGEALVDTSGTVREVWTIRPLSFDPAWPEFEACASTLRSPGPGTWRACSSCSRRWRRAGAPGGRSHWHASRMC